MHHTLRDDIYLRLYPALHRFGGFHILYRMVDRYFEDRVNEAAAHLAYFFLFSVFPIVIFLNALLALFAFDPNLLLSLETVIPQPLLELLSAYLGYLQRARSATLMYTGLALALWFFSRATRSLILDINKAMRIRRQRGPLHLFLLSMLLTVGLLFSVLLALLFVVTGRQVMQWVGQWLPTLVSLIEAWQPLRPLVTAGYFFVLLLAMYTVAPARPVRLAEALPGTLFAMAAWLASSMLFSLYVDNFSRYSLLYGSLGAIIVLMLWLYLLGVVLVMGAHLNAIVATNRQWRQRQAQIMLGDPPHYTFKD
ncbi:MAG: YihY/virulence factor BrkB family protein [Clostridiales bacterium]|nr:YihY/virulence factor BrkB family protein [Clostridiales bacterium]